MIILGEILMVFCNIFVFYTSTAPGNTKAEATIEIAKPSGGRLSRIKK